MLTSFTLTVSIFSTHWEGSSLNLEYLKENLPADLILTEYASGKLVLLLPENSSQVDPTEWPYNPAILAETHSGLWSTCLALSGGFLVWDELVRATIDLLNMIDGATIALLSTLARAMLGN